MSHTIMSMRDAILAHLTNITENTEGLFFSGYVAGLRDARTITRRNAQTGEKLSAEHFGNPGSWLGAIGYMTILDQIGDCFKPSDKATIDERNTIKKALMYFTELNSLEIDAIYALRNAFSHDYSLI